MPVTKILQPFNTIIYREARDPLIMENMHAMLSQPYSELFPNVLAWYDSQNLGGMNNSTTSKWFDCSGNGRHATMSNLGWTPGSNLDSTYGFSVDGVDDFATMADSTATRLTTGGTLAAWIYPKTVGETNGMILNKSVDTVVTNGYAFYLAASNRIVFRLNSGTSTVSSNNAITLNKWQFATVTFNDSGRALYINSISVAATGAAETALPPNVAGVVCIGNRAGATDRTFDGYIDKVGIINRVLSASEIRQIYQNNKRHYKL
jgi:hypothetical protein